MTPVEPILPLPMLAGVVFMFGCLIGSFLNVVIHRVPRDESIVVPGSHCPECGRMLSWYENIPLFSWLAQAARCRGCGRPISWRYPANEAFIGLLWVALVARDGLSLRFAGEAALVCALVAIFWIDLDTMLILDVITLPFIALGLAYGWLVAGAPVPCLLASAGGYGLFRLIEWASERLLGRPGMGRGDAKLAALMGAWLGPVGLTVGVFLSFLIGSAVGLLLLGVSGRRLEQLALPWGQARTYRSRYSQPFPFGPAMVAGALVAMFWGQPLWRWYTGLLGGA